mmetsp:Transcript_8200/g.24612  ORF Transcript_8200/g.24612 Transcript_8200/m.24612 type:complete len:222 (-) Transcript_8200:304-969(-)
MLPHASQVLPSPSRSEHKNVVVVVLPFVPVTQATGTAKFWVISHRAKASSDTKVAAGGTSGAMEEAGTPGEQTITSQPSKSARSCGPKRRATSQEPEDSRSRATSTWASVGPEGLLSSMATRDAPRSSARAAAASPEAPRPTTATRFPPRSTRRSWGSRRKSSSSLLSSPSLSLTTRPPLVARAPRLHCAAGRSRSRPGCLHPLVWDTPRCLQVLGLEVRG